MPVEKVAVFRPTRKETLAIDPRLADETRAVLGVLGKVRKQIATQLTEQGTISPQKLLAVTAQITEEGNVLDVAGVKALHRIMGEIAPNSDGSVDDRLAFYAVHDQVNPGLIKSYAFFSGIRQEDADAKKSKKEIRGDLSEKDVTPPRFRRRLIKRAQGVKEAVVDSTIANKRAKFAWDIFTKAVDAGDIELATGAYVQLVRSAGDVVAAEEVYKRFWEMRRGIRKFGILLPRAKEKLQAYNPPEFLRTLYMTTSEGEEARSATSSESPESPAMLDLPVIKQAAKQLQREGKESLKKVKTPLRKVVFQKIEDSLGKAGEWVETHVPKLKHALDASLEWAGERVLLTRRTVDRELKFGIQNAKGERNWVMKYRKWQLATWLIGPEHWDVPMTPPLPITHLPMLFSSIATNLFFNIPNAYVMAREGRIGRAALYTALVPLAVFVPLAVGDSFWYEAFLRWPFERWLQKKSLEKAERVLRGKKNNSRLKARLEKELGTTLEDQQNLLSRLAEEEQATRHELAETFGVLASLEERQKYIPRSNRGERLHLWKEIILKRIEKEENQHKLWLITKVRKLDELAQEDRKATELRESSRQAA